MIIIIYLLIIEFQFKLIVLLQYLLLVAVCMICFAQNVTVSRKYCNIVHQIPIVSRCPLKHYYVRAISDVFYNNIIEILLTELLSRQRKNIIIIVLKPLSDSRIQLHRNSLRLVKCVLKQLSIFFFTLSSGVAHYNKIIKRIIMPTT